MHVDRHLSKECYLRLIAPDILPPKLDRILYLDSDVIVLDQLRPLWETDLLGRSVAAVPDVLTQRPRAGLGLPTDHIYVNSGVLLIDLKAWRRRGITAKLKAFIGAKGALLEYHDQDALNAVLLDDILPLDYRWNLQTQHIRFGRRALGSVYGSIRAAARSPAILHYAGPNKPWLFRARTARKGDYLRFQDRTAWRGATPPLASRWQRAELGLDRCLARVGVGYLQVFHVLRRVPARAAAIVAETWHRTIGRLNRRRDAVRRRARRIDDA